MDIDYSDHIDPSCETCSDTGWHSKFCDGLHDIICHRSRKHLPHDFSVPCACRPMNRTWQEKQGAYVRTV